MAFDPKIAVVAIGGNATFPPHIRGTAEEQLAIVGASCRRLVDLVGAGYRFAITHGNGPVVGNILIRMFKAAETVEPMPLDVCVADTQGGIGYIIQQSMINALREAGWNTPVASVVTQVEVDAADPAFANPTKPVGPYCDEAEARRIEADTGWRFAEDPQGRGYRHVVPSPDPRAILEVEAIRALLDAGAIPIAAGGGGIPVIRSGGAVRGAPAVIDKDLAGAALALDLQAGTFLILTGVEKVALDFGTPNARFLDRITVDEARRYLDEGQFPDGSMGPKIRAALKYIEGGGKETVISSLDHIMDALAGKTGTRIVRSPGA